ncbi:D-glycero-alpha-D-manno-heptose-1,7-bisphosphate 7-phosphatase [Pedobacter endophyticus]|uniref:D,D-heptose 1,7-bisphosphate phosphatase n=1 Tax=Pedobacter endophyticus TaxID=2789740 RepID=A0A7S9L2H5_9SPHI|nr:HAD family hydrolase [Pedobacter endophyticus]QPH41280.1 HAD family hydrolase [Pedobacter endophyticus]
MEVKPAIFLDKDGTLIPDIPYNVDLNLITFNQGVIEGLRELQKDYLLIIVSNQSGIAKGLFTVDAFEELKHGLLDLFKEHQINISGFYFCPHDPHGTVKPYNTVCNCRKPAEGMLLKAAKDHAIDLPNSWMIGDILNDVEAGKLAGCQSILIDNGNETEWSLNGNLQRVPDFIASDFLEAVEFINQKERFYDWQSDQHIEKI